MKFSWNVDVKQIRMLLLGKKIKIDKSLKNSFHYFAWNFHEINSSDIKSDLISHPFNIMKVPFKLKHAIWDICMYENTYLQIRFRGFSIEFERAIRGVKMTSIFHFHETFMKKTILPQVIIGNNWRQNI